MLSLFLDQRVRLSIAGEFHELHFLFPQLPNISATFRMIWSITKRGSLLPHFDTPQGDAESQQHFYPHRWEDIFYFPYVLKFLSASLMSWGERQLCPRFRQKGWLVPAFISSWFAQDALVLTSRSSEWSLRSPGAGNNCTTGQVMLKGMNT